MKKLFKKIIVWIYITMHTWILRISIALHYVEQDIFKIEPISEKSKYNIRMRHQNKFAEMMLQGQRDEKFVVDYYELLKKANKFMRTATPHQIEMAADKWGMNYGKTDEEMKNVGRIAVEGKSVKREKDKWGRRIEHYGFFDPKSKNYGKTMVEVMREELKNRTLNDDQYPVEFIFTNKPIEDGLAKVKEIVETNNSKSDTGFESLNSYEKSKIKKFPMKIVRKNEVLNKIEQLTEYLHIKKINSKHRILEFFIPAKYKSFDLSENSDIFKEIIDIDQVWIKDEYGTLYGYRVTGYRKRTNKTIQLTENNGKIYKLIYDIIKLDAEVIEKII